MLSNSGGKGRCVECAGKYPELECCKVKGGHFWKVYEFDGWQKSKNPSMALASDAKSYCPDCYMKEVGRAWFLGLATVWSEVFSAPLLKGG